MPTLYATLLKIEAWRTKGNPFANYKEESLADKRASKGRLTVLHRKSFAAPNEEQMPHMSWFAACTTLEAK